MSRGGRMRICCSSDMRQILFSIFFSTIMVLLVQSHTIELTAQEHWNRARMLEAVSVPYHMISLPYIHVLLLVDEIHSRLDPSHSN